MFSSNTSAANGAANYIEDVFSTWLYTGNGSTQTINNGIDLAGKGGLVWLKARSTTGEHALFDTTRGTGTLLNTDSTNAARSETGFASFNSNGFSFANAGSTVAINFNGRLFSSWTFRKQPKFFDVVTWTGDGTSSKLVSHSLGAIPGAILIKRTDVTSDWVTLLDASPVVANSYAAGGSGMGTSTLALNNTDPNYSFITKTTVASSTTIDVAKTFYATYPSLNSTKTNTSGATYVAYLFADNAGGFGLTGTDNVITCGAFSSGSSVTVTLGYEPQWVLIKATGSSQNWVIYDSMRGMSVTGGVELYPNLSSEEVSRTVSVVPTATGFTITDTTNTAINGGTYCYIAIRRGPMKVPTTGTSVFTPYQVPASPTTGAITGFVTDAGFIGSRAGADKFSWGARLMGNPTLKSTNTNAESANTNQIWDRMNGWWNTAINNYMTWGFARAPGFMDVVCYTGNGTAGRTVTHNLGVAPELIICKSRSVPDDWPVFAGPLGNPASVSTTLRLNTTAAVASSAFWNNTAPTASVFTLPVGGYGNNNTGENYVSYLFASCPGVSKVGSYTGTGTTQQINCGFTAGARFVLIKRTDSTGDWYVWDSARGIVAGNDPYLLLNSTAAEVTGTDYVDTYSAGFEITSTAPAAINASGGTYIFLAIA